MMIPTSALHELKPDVIELLLGIPQPQDEADGDAGVGCSWILKRQQYRNDRAVVVHSPQPGMTEKSSLLVFSPERARGSPPEQEPEVEPPLLPGLHSQGPPAPRQAAADVQWSFLMLLLLQGGKAERRQICN